VVELNVLVSLGRWKLRTDGETAALKPGSAVAIRISF
jgi:hypothetical protein